MAVTDRLASHFYHGHLEAVATQGDRVAVYIPYFRTQPACRKQGPQFSQEFVAERAVFARPHHYHWRRACSHCGTTCRAIASTVREGTSPTAVT